MVVFATDYRSRGPLPAFVEDVSCGYRLASTTAGKYGGKPGEPVAALGYSFGAYWMLAASLTRPDPRDTSTAGACARGLPLPEVVVGLNGCYYTRQQAPFRVQDLDRRGVEVLIVDSADDTICPATDSTRVTVALRGAGLTPRRTTLSGANHFAAIFHDLVDDEWIDVPDDPAGERAVEVIADALRPGSAHRRP